MQRQTSKLLLILKEITNETPTRKSLKPDRIALQKIIYLLQELGFNFNFSFGWYLYGPYSNELATTLNLLRVEGTIKEKNWIISLGDKRYTKFYTKNRLLKSKEKQIVSKILKIINNKEVSHHLELVSSIHFIQHKMLNKDKGYKNQIWKRLQDLKPNKFSKTEFDIAWKDLKYLQLL